MTPSRTRFALALTLALTLPLHASAESLFGLDESAATTPDATVEAGVTGYSPNATGAFEPDPAGAFGLMDRLLPYVGAVFYPLGRVAMRSLYAPRALSATEKAYARTVFSGFAEKDRDRLVGAMKIAYDVPMRTPWSELQKMKAACESPDPAYRGVLAGIASVKVLSYGPCDLVSLVESQGWSEYLPKVTAGAQAMGPEIYIGRKLDLANARDRETLYHEMTHVKQWWESNRGTDVQRDMAMGYAYFKAHVDAGYDYASNAYESGAKSNGQRLSQSPQ